MAESLRFEALSIEDPEAPQEVEIKNLTKASKQIEDGNVMVIMRGVSGSGKSTIVKYLMTTLNTDCVCSADHYFMKRGTYNFDRNKIGQAHEYCQSKATQFCKEGHSVVIIDNTSVKRWETDFYVGLAKDCGYVVVMVTPSAQWRTSPEKLAARNKHGVDAALIRKKLQDFDAINPSYFAWFFTRRSTMQLTKIRDDALSKLAKHVSADITRAEFELKNVIAHVTAIFLGRVKERTQRHSIIDKLSQFIGTTASMEITDIVVTNRTVSARVKLPVSARKIYANDGGENAHTGRSGYKDLPKGSGAHITLGTTHGVAASEARSDMILSHLCSINGTRKQTYGASNEVTVYPEEKVRVISLNPHITLGSMFAAGYR